MKNNEYSKEAFGEDIHYVARRTYISDALDQSKNLDEIKNNVREKEAGHDLTGMIDKLINGETIEPRVEKMCTELLAEIQKKYPYVRGIVVLGSASHGGGIIRSLVDIDENDLDWGIIITQQKARELDIMKPELESLRKDADAFMNHNSYTFGFNKRLESCEVFNPESYVEPELDSFIVRFLLEREPRILVYYLQQTIPSELCQSNIALIKNELVNLKTQNSERYTKVCNVILQEWQEIHSIQEKHLTGFLDDNRTHSILRKLGHASKFPMSDYLQEILEEN
jgi:hypothetical protein